MGGIDWGQVLIVFVKPVFGAVMISFLVSSFVMYRDRKKLKSGDRSGYVSVSINYEYDDELHYGPLFERPLDDMLRNSLAVKLVQQAVKKKKKENEDPVLLLEVNSARFVYERIGDYVTEFFAESRLAHALGQPIIMGAYILALTFDTADTQAERKLRLLVIEESLLYKIAERGRMTVHSEKGIERAAVIDQIAALYVEEPERFGMKGLAVRAMEGSGVTYHNPRPQPASTGAAENRHDLSAHGFF